MKRATNNELQEILQRQLDRLLQNPCYGFDKSRIIIKTYAALKVEKLKTFFSFFLLMKK